MRKLQARGIAALISAQHPLAGVLLQSRSVNESLQTVGA
jgi:hypothetical protein